jgi:colanic acid/amylovoran biosynthesis glycosyltransferase
VLIAATFTEKKGIPYALQALGRLQHEVDLEVTIVGGAREELAEGREQKKQILGVIEAEGLAARVRLLGFQPHARVVSEAYDHHLFLSPSVTAADGGTEGGAPVAIIEMAATGMLIVSSRHCDIPEVIADGRTGLLADERDVDELFGCLVHAIRHPDEWPAMLAAGRRHIEAEFNAQNQGLRLAALYEGIACA